MANTVTVSHSGLNSGFQAGVINGNIDHVTIVQSETLNQECLRDLRTTNPFDDKERIKHTKGGLLKDSYRWILENEEFKQWQDNQMNCLLWIRGDPGKGKTMLLCGIIEELARIHGNSDDANISFFFCQATDPRINNATSVLRGLIYLLVEKHPPLLSYVRAHYDHAGKSLFEDVNAWNALSTIFKDILKDPVLQVHVTYLVIDALDECAQGLPALLDLIVRESSANPQIKWVVSSRNWPEITERLNVTKQLAPISLELNEASVSEAVNQFIRYKVQKLAETKKYSDKTRDAVQAYLLENSQGTFLWVALVCQNLEQIRMHVLRRLKTFPAGLDALYGRMIDQVRKSQDAELCKQILAIMATVFRPITIAELVSLIELFDDDDEEEDDHVPLEEIIGICGSFLSLQNQTIVFVHQSAKEFLLKETPVLGEIFPEGIEAEHSLIFERSLDTLFKTLKRDICNVKFPAMRAEDIRKSSPNPLIAAEYACVYWVDHLQGYGAASLDAHVKGRIDEFLLRKFLHWLEALGILGCVSDGIQAIQKLVGLVKDNDSTEPQELLSRIEDAYRFIRYYRTGIEISPLQVYFSPLIFSPSSSLTKITYQDESPEWVLKGPIVEECWSACLQTLEGHSDIVSSVAWSPDGALLASGCHDGTTRIWDPATGQSVFTLEEHGHWVSSIAWSPDGRQLASGSFDQLIHIWDPVTGQRLSTLEGHVMVNSISWSPDGNHLASGSSDNVILIWNLANGQTVSILETPRIITSLAWSPNGRQLASASSDLTVRVWDPATGKNTFTPKEHTYRINTIAWSPDGSQLSSGSNDCTVRIWDPSTGQNTFTLKVRYMVNSISWSPDGSQVALAADDNIYIWDPAKGQSMFTLEDQSGIITSVAWSPDGSRLASGSYNKSVEIWDPFMHQSMSSPSPKGHNKLITSVAWSPDGSRLASGSYDHTVQIWDPITSQSISTLGWHDDWVYPIAWSPDGSRLASGSGVTIHIWDLATEQRILTLKGHGKRISSIAWSPDGRRLASGSDDKTVRVWDSTTGQRIFTLNGHNGNLASISWSPDGSRLASGSDDKTVRVWDSATGQSLLTIPTGLTRFVDFDISDSNLVHTDVGMFDISSVDALTPLPNSSMLTCPINQSGYGLSDDWTWITYGELQHQILWLPPDCRPSVSSTFAVYANTIAMGCSSNRVIFLKLSDQCPIPGPRLQDEAS